MRVAIVVFSPNGNTYKVAKMLESSLSKRNIEVQVINLAREKAIQSQEELAQKFSTGLGKHDVLCIGGPVYTSHLHYNVKNIIKALPKPGNGMGQYAIPFVTYGSVSTGAALLEAAELLKETGRTVISAFKVDAHHSLARVLSINKNEGIPGNEIRPLLETVADKIINIQSNKIEDITGKLDYQKAKDKFNANFIFREVFWHRHFLPVLKTKLEKCIGCGKCVNVCPVQRLKIKNGKLAFKANGAECIQCTQCISVCKNDALNFKFMVSKGMWKKILSDAIDGKGPMSSRENPKSFVY